MHVAIAFVIMWSFQFWHIIELYLRLKGNQSSHMSFLLPSNYAGMLAVKEFGVCTSCLTVDSAAVDQGRKRAHHGEFPFWFILSEEAIEFPGPSGAVH